ncbi:hypothetical protein RB653_000859 [Dictyostelium firmibasis]|uniref:Oxysterol-binding protein n=1 Tax=Dictyostelium firmibasis TaxID=79012 RepID=A0AAN7Z1I3_9MYCE
MTDISDESNICYEEEVEEEIIEDDLDINNDCQDSDDKKKNSSFLKQFTSKQPFYKMSLPISYSEPRSFLEKLTDQGSYLDIFLKVKNIESEEERFLEILKFYLSGWIQQKIAKSPFNPVIGETYECKWVHKDGSTTEYIAEQISHHPPSSGFCMHNQQNGVIFHSYLSPTSKFWANSLENSMEGKLVYEIPSLDEEYIVEAPKIIVKGVLVGSLSTETVGSTNLICKKTGYSAEIDFKGKGLFKSKYSLLVKVKHQSSKKALYTLEGKFDGSVSITSTKTGKTTPFFDINSETTQPITLPSQELEENNSRVVWKHVIENLLNNNEDEASKQKTLVEENQRTLAKTREGKPWIPKNFTKCDNENDEDQNVYYYTKLIDIRKEIKKNN